MALKKEIKQGFKVHLSLALGMVGMRWIHEQGGIHVSPELSWLAGVLQKYTSVNTGACRNGLDLQIVGIRN